MLSVYVLPLSRIAQGHGWGSPKCDIRAEPNARLLDLTGHRTLINNAG